MGKCPLVAVVVARLPAARSELQPRRTSVPFGISQRRGGCIGLGGVLVLTMAVAFSTTACERQDLHGEYAILDELPLFDSPETRARVRELREALPYDSIAISYSDCDFGQCPQYSIKLRKSGIVSYRSGLYAPRSANSTSEIALFQYARICEFIETHAVVRQLQQDSLPAAEGAATYRLELWRAGSTGPTVFVREVNRGPTDVWMLRSAVDGLLPRLHWEVEAGNTGSDMS
jgi:hypothetical protein